MGTAMKEDFLHLNPSLVSEDKRQDLFERYGHCGTCLGPLYYPPNGQVEYNVPVFSSAHVICVDCGRGQDMPSDIAEKYTSYIHLEIEDDGYIDLSDEADDD